MQDPFALFSLAPTFELDARRLRVAWLQLASSVHPDAATSAAEDVAASESARINSAYQALLDPLLRAQALLERAGVSTRFSNQLPDGFLMELMELRERADEVAGTTAGTRALREEVVRCRSDALASMGDAFGRLAQAGATERESIADEIRVQINVVRSYDRVLEQLDRESNASQS